MGKEAMCLLCFSTLLITGLTNKVSGQNSQREQYVNALFSHSMEESIPYELYRGTLAFVDADLDKIGIIWIRNSKAVLHKSSDPVDPGFQFALPTLIQGCHINSNGGYIPFLQEPLIIEGLLHLELRDFEELVCTVRIDYEQLEVPNVLLYDVESYLENELHQEEGEWSIQISLQIPELFMESFSLSVPASHK